MGVSTSVLGLLVLLNGVHAPAVRHVRIAEADLRALVANAVVRSGTLDNIVTALERSNVIVYVGFGRCGGVDACLTFMAVAGTTLYVRATIDPFSKSPARVAGLIGHELQHARELAEAPVATREAFEAFFATQGRHGYRGYETDAAVRAGRLVEREALGSR